MGECTPYPQFTATSTMYKLKILVVIFNWGVHSVQYLISFDVYDYGLQSICCVVLTVRSVVEIIVERPVRGSPAELTSHT